MKRISFVLATIATIALLSCSSLEDSNFSAEDLKNLQQPQASEILPVDNEVLPLGFTPLAKPLQSYEEEKAVSGSGGATRATGSRTVVCTPYATNMNGGGFSDPIISCDLTGLPVGARVVNFQIIADGPTSTGGAPAIDFVRIQLGGYYGDFRPLSPANISTDAFAGLPADEMLYLGYYGHCNTAAACNLRYFNFRIYIIFIF